MNRRYAGMNNRNMSGKALTPLTTVIAVASLVLGIELLIMVLLHTVLVPRLPFELSDNVWNFVDAIVLTLLITPALYLLVFRRIQGGEARFRQMNASVQDAIIIIDQHGRVTDWNLAAQRTFQYGADEVLGRELHQLIVPTRFRAEMIRGFTRFQQNGNGDMVDKIIETLALRKDGSEFPVELSISAIREDGGWHAIGIARDITRRKQAEAILLERERDFQEAQLVGKVGSYVYNIQEDSWASSPMLDRIFGIDAEYQRTVAGWLKIVHPSQRDQMAAYLNSIIAEHRPFETEFHIVRPSDGVECWVMGMGTVEYTADGMPVRMVGTIQDITARKQAESEMARSLSLLNATLESTSDAILAVDMEGNWTLYNRKFIELWHIPDEIAKPRKDNSVLLYVKEQLEDPESFMNKVRELYATPEKSSFDIIQFKDGKVVERYSMPQIVDGQVVGRIWSFRDVTERKRIDATQSFLSESSYKHSGEDFFQALARFLAETLEMDFICIDRLEGDKLVAQTLAVCSMGEFEGNVSYVLKDTSFGMVVAERFCCFTSGVRQLFPHDGVLQKLPAESFVGTALLGRDGKPIGLIAAIGYQPLKNPEVAKSVLQMVSVRAAAELERQQNEQILHRMLSDANQSRQVMLSVIEDQKRSEDELSRLNDELENKVLVRTADLEHARVEAEQANRAKSAFLTTMSHEIRTPMNGVIGMIDVLQQSSLNERQMEMTNIIHDSAFSLLNIVNDILDFSKIEAGKLQIEFIAMDVAELIERTCETLDHIALKKGVELTLFTDPAIPASVLGDAGRLRQILINLISNAIRFSSKQPHQGKVSVRAILIEHNAGQAVLEFQIIDNGIGIDKATQARLFTAFTQADSSTTRKFGGTGLGLAISRQLANLMGGEIAVQSELDKGATFSARLPFAVPPEQPVASPAPWQVAGLPCLFVSEAHGLFRDLAVYLTHDGAIVTHADSMAAIRQWINTDMSGLCIVVFDVSNTVLSLNELRAESHARPDKDVRFVVVGRGRRRQCRKEASDIVALDAGVMNRRALLEAVAVASGQVEAQSYKYSTRKIKENARILSREEALRQGRLILVAEDNETNQKVILHQLALIGQVADMASNGREALELWQSGNYALLITDLNMPEMDGYELTTTIRARENGKTRMPIIAFSANALKGEAEHCRAIGMDDYLSKPVQLTSFRAMLEKWLPEAHGIIRHPDQKDSAGQELPLPVVADASLPVDVTVLKALVGSDAALIGELLHDFCIDMEVISKELRTACVTGRLATASTLAHKLKSSSRSVGALRLGELCAEIEQAGKTGDTEHLMKLLPGFERELADVKRYLDNY